LVGRRHIANGSGRRWCILTCERRLSAALAGLALLAATGCGQVIGLSDGYYVSAGADGGGAASVAGNGGGAGTGNAAGAGGNDTGLAGSSAGGAPSFVIPPGKLVFERYTTYEAGDSQMFVVTFPGGTISRDLGMDYGLCSPLNGIFSPDGTHLVVGATVRGAGPCPVLDRSQLELFVLDLDNPGQKQRITNNQVPDEDAQYSPAGDFILFKHDGNLARWVTGDAGFDDACSDPGGSFCFNHAYATANTTEQSKPVTDGHGLVCYGWGNSSDVTADIFCFNLQDGLAGMDITDPAVRLPAIVHKDLSDSRPVIAPPYLYFTRWRAPSSHVNEIGRTLLSDITGMQTIATFCTDVGVGYEDAFSLDGADLVVFSSNSNGLGKGDLFIGNFSKPESANLKDVSPGINTVNDELGAAFWPAP
jgi:hypothetical protein